jgi:hypothetical protein
MTITVPTNVSGYATTDDYFAQRSCQGGRTHYLIVLPLHQIPVTLPVPDPALPFEDNRQVRLSHAEAFAKYIRENQGWHAGPITVRGLSTELTFRAFEGQSDGPVTLGILSVPRNMRTAFRIIDGQHRILGVKILIDGLSQEIVDVSSDIAKSRRGGVDKSQAGSQDAIRDLERKLDGLNGLKNRIEADTMTIDLVVVDDDGAHKQIFIDVANNALSVQRAVTVRFDSKKVVNRAVVELISDPNTDPLINGRVDEQSDRLNGDNPNFIGSGTLAEVVRSLRKGIIGRFSAQDEESIDVQSLVSETNEFFSVLRGGFKPLADIASGKVAPSRLRKTHLVMSTTMIRILAAVYHELVKDGVDKAVITDYFRSLDRVGRTPLNSNTPTGRMWVKSSNGAFADGESAPGSRAQAKKDVVQQLVTWFRSPPAELGWKGSK